MTAVEDFANDYFITEGLTPGRQALVLRQLELLAAHAGAPPEALDDLAVRAFMASQLAAGLHVNTVRRNLSTLKPFYRWLWRGRRLDAERWMRISDIKSPRGSTNMGLPRPYALKEVRRFWDELDAMYPTADARWVSRYQRGLSPYRRVWKHAMHLQTQAIVSLALFSGLRSQEIRLIDIDELHPDNAYIVVSKGKGGRGGRKGHREVPYTVEGRHMIADWLALRDVLAPNHDRPWLVLSPHATPNAASPQLRSHPLEPIKLKAWDEQLRRIGAWELHRFRHTCGTEWLRAGVELEKVSKLLGHANIQQTLGYAELVRDDVARSVLRAEEDFTTAVGRRHRYLVG